MKSRSMFLNKLYHINSLESGENKDQYTAEIKLDKDHPVFKGHFPGNPILPGVCTVEIIKELLQQALNKELILSNAGNIKYLGFISPLTTPVVQFNLLNKITGTGSISCSATVSAGGNTLCSFKGEYLETTGKTRNH